MRKFIKISIVLILVLLLIVPASAVNLISNSGFETGSLSSWTVTVGSISSIAASSTEKQSGSYSCQYYESVVSSGVKYGNIKQDVSFDSAGNTLTFWVYEDITKGASPGYLYLNVYADSTVLAGYTDSDMTHHGWKQFTIDLTPFGLTGTKSLKFEVGYGKNVYDYVYIDTTDLEHVDPTANFSGVPVIGAAPLTVTFTNSDTHTMYYDWYFGDGTANSTLPNPTHEFTTAGTTYNVWHRASNLGGADIEYKISYITTNVTLNAEFNGTPTSGVVPLTVHFVDMSTGSPTAWNWSFGDGYVNSTKNPTHTYTNASTYTVSLIVTNPDGSDTETKTNYITVSGTATHTGMAIGGRIYDSISLLGLSAVQMTLVNVTSAWTTSTYTNTTGYYAFSNLSTSTSMQYVVSAVKSGYLDTGTTTFTLTPEEVNASYSDKSFGMEVIGSSATGGTGGAYAPHLVRFTVKTWAGEPIQDVAVTAIGVQSTAGEWAWLTKLFGFDFTSTPVTNTTLSGTTGVDGAITFWMVETVQYHMTFVKAGAIDTDLYIYPSEIEYPITAWGDVTPDIRTYINYSITAGQYNTTYSFINFSYSDSDFKTTQATITVTRIINATANTTEYSQSFFGAGACNFTGSYIFTSHTGYEYIATLYWENSVFGTNSISKSITIPGRQLDLRLKNEDYYAWIALALIYLIAQIGGAKRVRDVAVIMSLFALFAAWVGWLSTTTLLLQAAIFFAVLWYARSSDEGGG